MCPEQKGGVASRLPLSALLSQVLVAFTIEFDNEFEHQMPHRTTWGPAAHSRRGPWLVSLVMWSNFMQFVGEDGVPLRELVELARITNLKCLERWDTSLSSRTRCHTIPWCCSAAGFLMAVS
jgi:hypothetical protein